MPEVIFKTKFNGTVHGVKINAVKGDTADVPAGVVPLLAKFGYTEKPVTEKREDKPATAPAEEREVATSTDADQRETREAPAVPPTDEKSEPTAKDIRVWASLNDVDCPAQGRIPADVREKFEAAHADN